MRFFINNRGTFGVSCSTKGKKGGFLSGFLGCLIIIFLAYVVFK